MHMAYQPHLLPELLYIALDYEEIKLPKRAALFFILCIKQNHQKFINKYCKYLKNMLYYKYKKSEWDIRQYEKRAFIKKNKSE